MHFAYNFYNTYLIIEEGCDTDFIDQYIYMYRSVNIKISVSLFLHIVVIFEIIYTIAILLYLIISGVI